MTVSVMISLVSSKATSKLKFDSKASPFDIIST